MYLCVKDRLAQIKDLVATGRAEIKGQYNSSSLPDISVDGLVTKEDKLLFDCSNFRDGEHTRFTLYGALDGAVLNFMGDVYLGPMSFVVIEDGTDSIKIMIEQGKGRDHEEE